MIDQKNNPSIDEQTARQILDRYVEDCLKIDAHSLIAVFAIGSLAGGYYRPGQSDIDAVLIVENASDPVWGTIEKSSHLLEELNRHYFEIYKIPKAFGPFPLQVKELFPPYDPGADVLTLEIARLKIQGKLVYGHFDLDAVPMPTKDDLLIGAQRFEEWSRDEFSKTEAGKHMSSTACVNTILMHLSRFLLIKKGIFEFNKLKIVARYLENDPPYVNDRAFRLVMTSMSSRQLSEIDAGFLRDYVHELRPKMNAYLEILV